MKKVFSILISISLILMSVPAFAISGSGTEANPYLVSTPQDVCNIHNDLDGYYKLTADIDMSGIEFEPIGNESEGAFTGTIDGNGHTISNLNINFPDNKYVGFIGYLEGTAKNINLNNVDACGYRYVGGLVGYSDSNTPIENCEISGNVQCLCGIGTAYVGGIAGFGINIQNCYNNANVTQGFLTSSQASAYTGGISGNSETILNCINRGNVTASSKNRAWSSCGGISGNCNYAKHCENYGKIKYSLGYNAATSTAAGGICGVADKIDSCTNFGTIISMTRYSVYWQTEYRYSIGGIGGHVFEIINCANYGNAVCEEMTAEGNGIMGSGGIVGSAYEISKCINVGCGFSAGIAAIMENDGKNVYVENCYNSGMVKTFGITTAHSWRYLCEVKNCFNTGIIKPGYTFISGGSTASTPYCISANYTNSIFTYNVGYAPWELNSYSFGDGINENCYQLLITKSDRRNETLVSVQQLKNTILNDNWFIDSNTNSGFPQLLNMPRHIDLNECIEIFEVGDSDRLYAYIDGINESVTWSCDDNDIATVSSNGTVTAKTIGTCTVTATNSEGMKANCMIYVYDRANSINLNKSETFIAAGSTEKLTYTENPATANETVVWSSDNENIAAVEQDGTITAKTKGVANITATTTNSEISASCRVTVTGNPITSVSLSSTSATMNVGENKTLTATISPTEYAGTITWSSSNNDIATVDNGFITAKAPGTAVISVESDTNKTANCTVTVKAPVTELSFDKSDITLEKGYTQRLNLNVVPINTTDTISWSTSNSTYVSVSSDGIITANRVGTATITATSTSGKKAYCVVNVTEPTISVSSVTLNKPEIIMTQADKTQLTAEVLPSNATNKDLVWTSSDESVATVSNTGVVTATGVGTSIIKATANNGMYHECAVKVISASGSSVILSGAKASPNGTAQVKASIVRNPGISGYKFTVDYDDTLLTPVSVEANTEFGGTLTTNLDDPNRTEFNILWYSDSNVDTNSDLFTIIFEVKDSAQYGDASAITLSYGAKDICNTSGDSIALYIQDSTISIAEPLPGDVYEDDDVSVFDLTLLARYITGLETFTDRQLEAADVNDDNEVDIKDVVTLAQYIVGWSNIQLMSLRSFGAETANIKVGTASVNEMFEAEIPVCISNNPGVAGFRYVIEHSDDLEVLSITPTMDTIKDKFQTNLGQQGNNDLIVSWYDTDNMTENGELFTIKVRLTNPDTDISQISIKPADNNMCNENKQDVIAEYEDGYVMSSNYIIANQTITDTTFACELYFDNTFAEQTAKAILGFYNEQNKLVQFALKDITVKPGKVDLNFDIEDKPYSTYKLMLWEGLNSMRPLVDVR